MEYVGQLGSKRACLAFCDYIKLNGLELQVKELNDSGLVIYSLYANEADLARVQAEFDEFIANPHQEKYLSASWAVSSPSVPGGSSSGLGLSTIWSSVGVITQIITALCLLIFLGSYLGWYREIFFALKFSFDGSEPYRLLTPAIMHLSAVHLVFNLAWWWYLGGKVERVLGGKTLIAVFFISAVFSNILQAFIVNDQFAGLSGVNYALAGFVWICGFIHKSNKLYLPNNLFVFLIAWMIIGFVDVLPISMANWAHLGGLLAGVILAMLIVKPKNKKGSL